MKTFSHLIACMGLLVSIAATAADEQPQTLFTDVNIFNGSENKLVDWFR